MFAATKDERSSENKSEHDKFLLRLLLYFLCAIFAVTVEFALINGANLECWAIGDWLINYQAGFVRRGLIGEIFFFISSFSGISLVSLTVAVQCFCYLFFFVSVYWLVKAQNHISANLLVLFSPFLFLFQVNDRIGGFHKEILLFCLLGLAANLAVYCREKVFWRWFRLIMLLFPLAVMSHEMMIVFLPYLLLIAFIKVGISPRIFTTLLALSLLSLAVFALCVANPGSQEKVVKIHEAIFKISDAPHVYFRGILALKFRLNDQWRDIQFRLARQNYILRYSTLLLLSLLTFLPLRNKLRLLFRHVMLRFLLFSSWAGSLVLLSVGCDWGRFIQINLVALFIVTLVLNRENERFDPVYPRLCLLVALLFLLGWHIPHCCDIRFVMNNVLFKAMR